MYRGNHRYCVRWYLRFSLSLREEELMAERGLSVDHTTFWRWTQTPLQASGALGSWVFPRFASIAGVALAQSTDNKSGGPKELQTSYPAARPD